VDFLALYWVYQLFKRYLSVAEAAAVELPVTKVWVLEVVLEAFFLAHLLLI
jgi:hypothetical protein